MIVYVLTEAEKDLLADQFFTPNDKFNPVLDGDTPSDWVISEQEVEQNQYPEFNWIKSLPTKTWVTPIPPIPNN
jgi:hypothetical protein